MLEPGSTTGLGAIRVQLSASGGLDSLWLCFSCKPRTTVEAYEMTSHHDVLHSFYPYFGSFLSDYFNFIQSSMLIVVQSNWGKSPQFP